MSYRGAARPRLLAYGFNASEVDAIKPLAGSLQITTDLTEVHPEEHDVLLLADSQLENYRQGFPRRLVFAPAPASLDAKPADLIAAYSVAFGGSGEQPATTAQTQFKPARDIEITDFARKAGLEPLVRRSCLPEEGETYTGFKLPVHPTYATHAFAKEALKRPLVLAALLETDPAEWSASSVFWLPAAARTNIADWLHVALAWWRRTAPDTFPVTADWHRSDRWASPQETNSRAQLVAFEAEQLERQEVAQKSRAFLTTALDQAEREGTSWRAILLESGDTLVKAVQDVLVSLGFEVVQSDELPQHKGKKREDLRVIDGDWTAVVEVKGYSGAAKSNDLLQLTSAAATFAAETGRLPSALWYVPNSYREIDPAQRAIPLAGREDDVEAFAENHDGCMIDTRDLFTLRQQTVRGEVTQVEARETLKRATGRLRLMDKH